jgi:hypothetical protein
MTAWRAAEPMTGSGVRPLDRLCGEQGKLHTAKALKLAERDKHMSEQTKPQSFMQELDAWTDREIIAPVVRATESDELRMLAEARAGVRRSIRAKVLESYRNGQAAGPRFPKQPQMGGR